MIRFSVWLVSSYAHVFILLSVVIATLPATTLHGLVVGQHRQIMRNCRHQFRSCCSIPPLLVPIFRPPASCHSLHGLSKRQKDSNVGCNIVRCNTPLHQLYTVAEKVSHFRISLNRIENQSMWLDFALNLECKRSSRIFSVVSKYSMRDSLCNVINYCVWSCYIGKISVCMIKS